MKCILYVAPPRSPLALLLVLAGGKEHCTTSCALRETVANLTSHQVATNTCEKEQHKDSS